MRAEGSIAVAAICVAIAGCGAGARQSTGNHGRTQSVQSVQAARACSLDARVMARAETIEMPGTRVRISMPYPQEIILIRGMPIAAHECGLAIFVVPAPLDGTGREFLDGAVTGALDELRARGMSCEPGRSGAAWRCSSADAVAFVRRIGPPEDGALVSVEGPPSDSQSLQAIAGSAEYDPHAVFDPLEQMSIALELPQGMTMAPGAVAGDLRYEAAAPPGGFVADVHWAYVPYASLDAHADGSEWSDREVGRVAGELTAEAGIDSLVEGSMRPLSESPDGSVIEITIEGTRAGAPVLIYIRSVRDVAGVFYAIGRIAAPEVATWLPRVRAHAATLRALD